MHTFVWIRTCKVPDYQLGSDSHFSRIAFTCGDRQLTIFVSSISPQESFLAKQMLYKMQQARMILAATWGAYRRSPLGLAKQRHWLLRRWQCPSFPARPCYTGALPGSKGAWLGPSAMSAVGNWNPLQKIYTTKKHYDFPYVHKTLDTPNQNGSPGFRSVHKPGHNCG